MEERSTVIVVDGEGERLNALGTTLRFLALPGGSTRATASST